MGASWSHTQAHFSRAILESIAYEYAYYLRILKELLPRFELTEARAVGGGARSAVWNQIKADVLNVQYQRLKGNEFGTWGAAMIAGKAAGVIDDLAVHAEQTAHRDGEAVLPSAETHAAYLPLIKKYIALEEAMQHFFAGEAV